MRVGEKRWLIRDRMVPRPRLLFDFVFITAAVAVCAIVSVSAVVALVGTLSCVLRASAASLVDAVSA